MQASTVATRPAAGEPLQETTQRLLDLPEERLGLQTQPQHRDAQGQATTEGEVVVAEGVLDGREITGGWARAS